MGKLKNSDILLIKMVNGLGEEASTLSILEEMKIRTGKKVSIGSLHKSLFKLWGQGLLDSEKTTATEVRGWRRRRVFTVTAYGFKSLNLIDAKEEF